uniref:Uncharacterized protein n=1 Tax=Brassica oleracea TaxID=3712 RepID=Q2A9X1_BRAOL|nr:hypothetical protein 24.t00027 [Brassica oleracea]
MKPRSITIGLRFFVWAGTQSGHRHSPYMYIKACDLLKIKANPDLIKDVVEGYNKDECFVSVKDDEDDRSVSLEILDVAEKMMKEMDCVGLCPYVITQVGALENGEDLSKLVKLGGVSQGVMIVGKGRSWEAAKLAMMVDKKMGLKGSLVETIIEALKKTGDETVANVIDSALKGYGREDQIPAFSYCNVLTLQLKGKISSKNFILSEARNLSSVKWKVWLN